MAYIVLKYQEKKVNKVLVFNEQTERRFPLNKSV